jgi:hypothetical protein
MFIAKEWAGPFVLWLVDVDCEDWGEEESTRTIWMLIGVGRREVDRVAFVLIILAVLLLLFPCFRVVCDGSDLLLLLLLLVVVLVVVLVLLQVPGLAGEEAAGVLSDACCCWR